MYRALYERAFTLACEARIHIEVSEDNALSCFFLDVLGKREISFSFFAETPDAKYRSQLLNRSAMGGCLCFACAYSRWVSGGCGTQSGCLERLHGKLGVLLGACYIHGTV